jgi:signal peptidase I
VTSEPTLEPPEPSRARRSGFGCIIELVETLVLTLVIFFVIQTFVAQPFQVKMNSMQHTFEQGDYVLIDKLTPRWDAYSRGDVVVFDPPATWTTEKTPFIKRVIGVGGDTIEVRPDGLVYANGAALEEPYLYSDGASPLEPTTADQAQWIVPDGELFVMGDHRHVSADSRVHGTIPVSSVLGRAVVRYWPISAFGIVQTPIYGGVPSQ